MNRLPALIVFIFIFSSCADHSKSAANELVVFKATEQGLTNSNKALSISTQISYRALEQRRLNPKTSEVASKWEPKAKAIRQLSDNIASHIETLKRDLKEQAGATTVDGKEIIHEDNMGAVTRLFDEKGMGRELHEKLEDYEQAMLAVDPEINAEFGPVFTSITRAFREDRTDSKNFTTTYFSRIPVIAALAMLSRIENDARNMENQMVQYCLSKTSTVAYIDDLNIRPLVSQSSYFLMPGQQMEITAGIGSFSAAVKPVISVNGIQIKAGEDGVANYTFTAPAKPGEYPVKVVINFTKPDGTPGIVTKTLQYTVGLIKTD